MRTLGIDPGAYTGLAVWDHVKNEILFLRTVKRADAFTAALEAARSNQVDDVVIERPKGNVRSRGMSNARAKAFAINVGQNIGFSDEITRRFQEAGFRVKQVSPRKVFTKWGASAFQSAFAYSGRSSEHARDAACIARFSA